MKAVLSILLATLFVAPAFATEPACVGTKGTPETAKFYFVPVGKEVDTGNEGEELDYRIKLTYKDKTLLNKVVKAYLFEDVIYFNGDQKEEAWVSAVTPEDSGLKVPALNLNLNLNCVPVLGHPFKVTE